MPRALRAVPSSRRAPTLREMSSARVPASSASSSQDQAAASSAKPAYTRAERVLTSPSGSRSMAPRKAFRDATASPATNCTHPRRSSSAARVRVVGSVGQGVLEEPYGG